MAIPTIQVHVQREVFPKKRPKHRATDPNYQLHPDGGGYCRTMRLQAWPPHGHRMCTA